MSLASTALSAITMGFEEAAGQAMSTSFTDRAKALVADHPIAAGATMALAAVGTAYTGYRLIKRFSAPAAEMTPQ